MSEEDQNIDAKLRRLACRVGEVIRAKISEDEYNMLRAQIQTKLLIRRAERKKTIAIEKVSHPVQSAMRTKGIRDRRKVAKRRNIEQHKNHTMPKRKKKFHE